MKVPMEITWRGVESSAELDMLIREKVRKLERHFSILNSCRVAIERPNESLTTGSGFRVRIDMTVSPGHELVVRREPGEGDLHDGLPTVVRSAFEAAHRVLNKQKEIEHGRVKAHPTQDVTGIVDRIFPTENYGFLRNTDGYDVYFHRNSVLGGEFDRLKRGDGVRHIEEEGNKGLQATTVHLVDRQPRV